MQIIPLEQTETHLNEINGQLSLSEESMLSRDNKPVKTLRAIAATPREPPRFGTLKGTILYIAPDFDDIPEGFEA